jgi:threonine dehydratase
VARFTANPACTSSSGGASHEAPSLAGVEISPARIEAARTHLRGLATRTPLVRSQPPGGGSDLGLKLETLQPIGSFKIRGAGSALRAAPRARLAEGVYTASAGNMAQGVAWCAREMGVACRVIVPEHAPTAKLAAVERLGGMVTKVSFDRWWQVLVERAYPGLGGLFVHPVADPLVIAGNATIAQEILDEVPDVDTVLVPFGGGGLSCGIAIGLQALGSTARVIACEVETAAPFEAALAAGHAVQIEHHPSFVDGIGGRGLLTEMWPLASRLLAGTVVVSLAEIADAMRYLASRARTVAEGAGGASVAAALSGVATGGRVVAVVSGGSVDLSTLAAILDGRLP